jgi:hypothetical protein
MSWSPLVVSIKVLRCFIDCGGKSEVATGTNWPADPLAVPVWENNAACENPARHTSESCSLLELASTSSSHVQNYDSDAQRSISLAQGNGSDAPRPLFAPQGMYSDTSDAPRPLFAPQGMYSNTSDEPRPFFSPQGISSDTVQSPELTTPLYLAAPGSDATPFLTPGSSGAPSLHGTLRACVADSLGLGSASRVRHMS